MATQIVTRNGYRGIAAVSRPAPIRKHEWHTQQVTSPDLYDEEEPFDPKKDIVFPYPDVVRTKEGLRPVNYATFVNRTKEILARGTKRWDDTRPEEGAYKDASLALRNSSFEDIVQQAYLFWFERSSANQPASVDISIERAITWAAKPSHGMTGMRGHTRAEDLHATQTSMYAAEDAEEDPIDLFEAILDAIMLDHDMDSVLMQELKQLRHELASPLPEDPRSGLFVKTCAPVEDISSTSGDVGFTVTDRYEMGDDRFSNRDLLDPLQQYDEPDFTYGSEPRLAPAPERDEEQDLPTLLRALGYLIAETSRNGEDPRPDIGLYHPYPMTAERRRKLEAKRRIQAQLRRKLNQLIAKEAAIA